MGHDRDVDLDLLRAWGLPAPTGVAPPPRGTNNEVLLVEAGGGRYVVRGYQNLQVGQIEREHALLRRLDGDAGLGLAVPVPVPLPDGRTLLVGEHPPMAVFGYLEGEPPARSTAAPSGVRPDLGVHPHLPLDRRLVDGADREGVGDHDR